MDMEFTEEQRHVADAVRRLMETECTPDRVREAETSDHGYSRELWKQMADLGWLGLRFPQEYDGFGLGAMDLVVLTKELGRALCPSPYLSTVVLSGGAIAAAGTDEQKQAHLPRIVSGDAVIPFAFQEASRYYDPRGVRMAAMRDNGNFVLNGTKMFVEFANEGDLLLVVARTSGEPPATEGLTMFLVDANSPDVTMSPLPTMARDKQCEVALKDVSVASDRVVGPLDGAWRLLEGVIQQGAVALSAYAVGAAEKMHEMATAFAKDRVQFGRPIGSLQTIQGYLAQLITEIWGAETLTYHAAWTIDEGRPARELVAKAKAFAGDTLKRTTDIGSQIFGGIGYMEEMDSTLYLRRGKQYQLSLGDSGYWEDIVAEEVLG